MRQIQLKNGVNTGVRYSTSFLILDAVIESGLDLERYLNNGYDPRILETVVAWKNTKDRVSAHQQDAISIESDKRSKRKGRR